MTDQPDHQRFNGERNEHRHHDIEDDGVDFAPRFPDEHSEEHGDHSIEKPAAPPFRRAPGVALLREDRGEIDLRFTLFIHGSPFYIAGGNRRLWRIRRIAGRVLRLLWETK